MRDNLLVFLECAGVSYYIIVLVFLKFRINNNKNHSIRPSKFILFRIEISILLDGLTVIVKFIFFTFLKDKEIFSIKL